MSGATPPSWPRSSALVAATRSASCGPSLARIRETAKELARQRLRGVRALAETKARKKLDCSDRGLDVGGPWWSGVLAVGRLVTGLGLLALVVTGLNSVIGWIR